MVAIVVALSISPPRTIQTGGHKMLIVDFYKVPISIALITVFGILILSIVGSIYFPQKEKKEQEPLIKA